MWEETHDNIHLELKVENVTRILKTDNRVVTLKEVKTEGTYEIRMSHGDKLLSIPFKLRKIDIYQFMRELGWREKTNLHARMATKIYGKLRTRMNELIDSKTIPDCDIIPTLKEKLGVELMTFAKLPLFLQFYSIADYDYIIGCFFYEMIFGNELKRRIRVENVENDKKNGVFEDKEGNRIICISYSNKLLTISKITKGTFNFKGNFEQLYEFLREMFFELIESNTTLPDDTIQTFVDNLCQKYDDIKMTPFAWSDGDFFTLLKFNKKKNIFVSDYNEARDIAYELYKQRDIIFPS